MDASSGDAALIDEFIRIPLPSGRVLAAHLWRPANGDRVPAILDISPYRAFDVFRTLEEPLLPWWAARGYAVLAIDTAGSGGSTGLLADEYLPSEIDDAVACVAWAAAQPWCDGAVGLSGLSWAAFTALRAAGRAPPALKAMVLGGVSEDGWATDIHGLGGAPYTALVDWAGVMLMFNALPPDPKQFGDGWREAWLARLAANRPWAIPWLTHLERDGYWQGKAAPTDGTVPLLLYSGWADKYATSVLRIAAGWRGPVRTIIGPWEHATPTTASRGPRIGFLQEALRWWDQWLKGRETGVMAEPGLRYWLAEPDRRGGLERGVWRGVAWPMAQLRSVQWRFGPRRTVLKPAPRTPGRLTEDLYEDAPGAWPADGALLTQAAVGDGEVFMPVLRARVRSVPAGGILVARLLDVAPDGTAVRMTTGALNLAFADGTGRAARARDGESLDVILPFQAVAWRLKAGHRVGLLLSADGWPTLWPARAGGTLTLDPAHLELSLPHTSFDTVDVTPFAPPVTAKGATLGPPKWLDPSQEALLPTGLAGAAAHAPEATAYHLGETGTDYRLASRFEVALMGQGRQAVAAKVYRAAFERPGWSVRVATRLVVRSTPGTFEIAWTVQGIENGRTIFDHSDAVSVPRGVA